MPEKWKPEKPLGDDPLPMIEFSLDTEGKYKIHIDAYRSGELAVSFSTPHQAKTMFVRGNESFFSDSWPRGPSYFFLG